MPLTEAAPAKINLYLHVTGRRDDGYHRLDSLAVFADAADHLTAEPSNALSLAIEGPFAAGLRTEPDNLVLRAAHALARHAGIAPTGRLTLIKNLPVASGIGGGSADAAAALRLLCRHWSITIAPEALHEIATSLGADVPVCLGGTPARMSGIGEHLAPAPPLPDIGLTLINPGVSVSTPTVFRARTGGFSLPADLPAGGWPDAMALVTTLRATRNDLQTPAVSLVPTIADALAALSADPACLLARMSGSGATCFGIYACPDSATAAARRLRRPDWWVQGGGLHQPKRF